MLFRIYSKTAPHSHPFRRHTRDEINSDQEHFADSEYTLRSIQTLEFSHFLSAWNGLQGATFNISIRVIET